MVDVRRAGAEDVSELVRLRAILMESIPGQQKQQSRQEADGWRETCARMLRAELAHPEPTMVACVVDAPGGTGSLAACGIGVIDRRLPSPARPDGRCGYILSMVTDPGHRKQGYARAILTALQEWFHSQRVLRVDLHATSDGESLYRDAGFTEHVDPALSWTDQSPRH